MSIYDIIVPLFFIVIILKQIKYIKVLIIPTRKTYVETITVLLSVVVFIGLTYFYANTWVHYVAGVLAIVMFVSMWIKHGIYSKGFISMYRLKEIILWNEIEKVMVISSKNIKVVVACGFMEQTFHFKNSDYDKIITILKENLPEQAQIQTIINE
ncbi:MAG: hypothetical protein ACREVX_03630 [Clostridium sp.]|uniref:hypothetical protein n=1 Tax=Clostridium sp. TaxID=1506 RepID=UPI003D6C8F8C